MSFNNTNTNFQENINYQNQQPQFTPLQYIPQQQQQYTPDVRPRDPIQNNNQDDNGTNGNGNGDSGNNSSGNGNSNNNGEGNNGGGNNGDSGNDGDVSQDDCINHFPIPPPTIPTQIPPNVDETHFGMNLEFTPVVDIVINKPKLRLANFANGNFSRKCYR